MKRIIALVCASLIICLSGCKSSGISSANIETSETDLPIIEVTPIIVDVTTIVPAKTAGSVSYNMGELFLTDPIRTDAEKFTIDNAVVVHGKVVDSHYVLLGSTVFTKSNVEVLKCYQGDLTEGSIISVKELGGFIPSDVFNNAVYQEKFGTDAPKTSVVETLDMRVEGFKVMESNEDVILFLVPTEDPQIEEFEGGCYELIRIWQGKLLYNSDVNAFIPYVPVDELAPIPEETNETASVQVNNVGISDAGIEARAYTLEEFESFVANLRIVGND